ncbi:Protein of unknown function DUF2147 [Thiorhodococcus drewsii AZ1]|uniref:DUF2147 domain-containing protein n=1 Tax=Thiorhodococcus drewsii AZ1 TaxID=765913 RepID=G2DWX7_9GAMM|nr:DUF2147 domain-containing protein [Thiorhodococcus drewsii]EGV33331.1 Protein of unknown function DUF2147 [Thiorhodococcus drewsii AZ1]
MMRRFRLLGILVLLVPLAAWSAEPSPVGFWLVQDGGAVVRLQEFGGVLNGRTVWMKESSYPSDDPEGRAGKPLLDDFNPNPALREHKRLGLQILSGFVPGDTPGVYSGGQVYNPRDGKTYSGTITLAGKDRLELRGYVVISLLGKTQTWTRVDPAKYGLKP